MHVCTYKYICIYFLNIFLRLCLYLCWENNHELSAQFSHHPKCDLSRFGSHAKHTNIHTDAIYRACAQIYCFFFIKNSQIFINWQNGPTLIQLSVQIHENYTFEIHPQTHKHTNKRIFMPVYVCTAVYCVYERCKLQKYKYQS